MRWSWCLAGLLVCACKQGGESGSRQDSTQRAGAARPAPAQVPSAPTPPEHVAPFTPLTAAASFLSRSTNSLHEDELSLASYTLEVQVADGTATSTLDVQVTNPTAAQAEAIIDLPVPPSAAVTDATLWVGDKPMAGVMLGSDKARHVHDNVVGRRPDLLRVSWRHRELLGLSIFPLEAKQTRRFQISWVEPLVADQHWVPAFYNKGNEIGFPSAITVNGQSARREGHWVKIPKTLAPSAGDWRLIVQPVTTPTMVAVIIDTSGQLDAARGPQWREVEEFVSALSGRAKVTLLAADWLLDELGTGQTLTDLDAARDEFMAIRSAGLFDQQQALERAGVLAGATGAIVVFSGRSPNEMRLPDSVRSPIYWLDRHTSLESFGPVDRSGGKVVFDASSIGKSVHSLTPPNDGSFDWLPLEAATGHVLWIGSRKGASLLSNAKPTPMEAIFYKAMVPRSEIPHNKIVSPRTSILVLESDAQYAQFGIKNDKGEIIRDRDLPSTTISGLLQQQKEIDDRRAVGGRGPGGSGNGSPTIGTGCVGQIGHRPGWGIGERRRADRQHSAPQIRRSGPLWTKARALLDAAKPGHLQAISELFGIQGSTDRTELAWQLAEGPLRSNKTPLTGFITVARLLRESGSSKNDNDARRVLSEGAICHPAETSGQLRAWGHTEDAERMLKQPRGWGAIRAVDW